MKTIDYDALIEKHLGIGDEMIQRKRASKLAEVARNFESLHELAEAEERRASDAAEAALTAERAKK